MLLHTWMNNLFRAHTLYVILLSCSRCALSGLHDSLTWSLPDSLSDGRGGLTSGCRLTFSVGNWSVPVVLIRCLGLGASVMAWLCVAYLLRLKQAACVTHQQCLLVWSGSPGKVRRVFKMLFAGRPRAIFFSFQCGLKRPCDWELSNCCRA